MRLINSVIIIHIYIFNLSFYIYVYIYIDRPNFAFARNDQGYKMNVKPKNWSVEKPEEKMPPGVGLEPMTPEHH